MRNILKLILLFENNDLNVFKINMHSKFTNFELIVRPHDIESLNYYYFSKGIKHFQNHMKPARIQSTNKVFLYCVLFIHSFLSLTHGCTLAQSFLKKLPHKQPDSLIGIQK